MERVCCIIMSGISINFFLYFIEECCIFCERLTVCPQHTWPLDRTPGSLLAHFCRRIFGSNIYRHHSAISLKDRLHAELSHDKLIFSCELRSLSEPGIMNRAAITGKICHIGPCIVGRSGNEIFGFLMSITKFCKETSPDFFLSCGIKNYIYTIQCKPV